MRRKILVLILSISGSFVCGAFPEIDSLFEDYNKPNVPGASVLVVQEGKVLYEKAYGLSNLENKSPSTTRTNYRLASLTKAFTAMAALILVDRGTLHIENALTDFFPDFPAYGRHITVEHLLHHTSGLRDYEELIAQGQVEQLLDRDVLEIMKQQTSGYFPPGDQYRYSNSGYVLLAMIIEKLSRRTFASFLKDQIFLPLRMHGTVAYEKGISEVEHRSFGYSRSESGFNRTDQSLTSAVLGDGGVYTSVSDLIRWDQVLYTDRLVSLETLNLAFTPGTLNDGRKIPYGFGWMLDSYKGLRRIHHTGSTIGFRTAIQRFPERRFCVVVLVNRAESQPWEIARRIVDRFLFN